MNITTTKGFQNVVLALGAGLVALVAVISLPAPAHAQEFGDSGFYDGGGFDGGYTGGDWSGYGSFGDTGSCGYGCGTSYSTDYTGGDWSGYGSFGDTGSCGYGCGSDYGYSDYGSSGYGYGGSSYLPSSFYQPYQPAGNVNQNTNVNQNYCTNGSCNTNNSSSVNAPTTIITNYPAQQTQQPVYYPQPTYQPTYHPTYQPVAYNTQRAPYVSLSAVPYTGLDLGPWGTAAYWGFLILWCLGAAYLIVVKRVQNKLVSALNGFLFGTTKTTHTVAYSAPVVKHTAPAAPQFSGIDPFIASQISRAAF